MAAARKRRKASGVVVERGECLILHAPQWFKRKDFLDWRQGKCEGQWHRSACWLPRKRTGEYTDVFVVFDRRWHGDGLDPGLEHLWEGSDCDYLPDDIFEEIGHLLHQHGLVYGVLWIKPT